MFWNTIAAFFESSGIAGFFVSGGWKNIVMILVACVLLFLAIKKDFEPYLLLPIAFGMLLVNLPFVAKEIFAKGTTEYNPISLAAAVGLTTDQSNFIFKQALDWGIIKEGNVLTTEQIHEVVMHTDPKFLDVAPAALEFNETIIDNLDHLYSYDYTGIFGYLPNAFSKNAAGSQAQD